MAPRDTERDALPGELIYESCWDDLDDDAYCDECYGTRGSEDCLGEWQPCWVCDGTGLLP